MCRRLHRQRQLSWWIRKKVGFWGDPERFHSFVAYESSAAQRLAEGKRHKGAAAAWFLLWKRRCKGVVAYLIHAGGTRDLSPRSCGRSLSIGGQVVASSPLHMHVDAAPIKELCGGEDAAVRAPSELAMLTAAPLLGGFVVAASLGVEARVLWFQP